MSGVRVNYVDHLIQGPCTLYGETSESLHSDYEKSIHSPIIGDTYLLVQRKGIKIGIKRLVFVLFGGLLIQYG